MSPAARHSLFLVPSASHAVKGEAALKRARIECALIPVPRTLSSQCGVCLRARREDRAQAAAILDAAGVEISSIHDIDMKPRRRETAHGHAAAD